MSEYNFPPLGTTVEHWYGDEWIEVEVDEHDDSDGTFHVKWGDKDCSCDDDGEECEDGCETEFDDWCKADEEGKENTWGWRYPDRSTTEVKDYTTLQFRRTPGLQNAITVRAKHRPDVTFTIHAEKLREMLAVIAPPADAPWTTL